MKKPFKISAYSFIILLVIGNILGFFMGGAVGFLPAGSFSGVQYWTSIAYNIVSFVLVFFVFNGFILLGKKYRKKTIVVYSWIGIFLMLLLSIYGIFGSYFVNVPEIPTQDNFVVDNQFSDIAVDFFIFLLIMHLIYSIVLGIISIIWGIALLKLNGKIKYAKAAGILNILTGATMIIFIGYIIAIAAVILEILILFEASKKFDK